MRFFVYMPGETISMNDGGSRARTYSNADTDDAYRAYGDARAPELRADADARGSAGRILWPMRMLMMFVIRVSVRMNYWLRHLCNSEARASELRNDA